MSPERTRTILRGAVTIVAVLAAYEAMARSGVFPRALLPTLPTIADRLGEMIADGTMFWHVVYTLYRMLSGFALLTFGLGLGIYVLAQAPNIEAYRGDSKVLWSALVWLLYLGLLVMRWKFAQGGRRFALPLAAKYSTGGTVCQRWNGPREAAARRGEALCDVVIRLCRLVGRRA